MTDPSIVLDVEPDWSEKPNISYNFLTAIAQTPYFVEQRRPLLPSPTRSVSYTFTESGSDIQRARNRLAAAAGQKICVPIFQEPIFASSIQTGGSIIVATTPLGNLWNAQNCDYVVLINFYTGASEMIGCERVDGTWIRLSSSIVGTWPTDETVVYPAFVGYMKAFRDNNITDGLGKLSAEFEEISESAEASFEWEGIVDKGYHSYTALQVDKNMYTDDVSESDLQDGIIDKSRTGTIALGMWPAQFNYVRTKFEKIDGMAAEEPSGNFAPGWRSICPNNWSGWWGVGVDNGDGASNGELLRLFQPKGIHFLEFDFYHTDYMIEPYYTNWGADNLNGSWEIFAAFLPDPVQYYTGVSQYAQPYHVPSVGGLCAIRFNLRSFSSSRVTLRQYLPDGLGSYTMSYLTSPYGSTGECGIITGLRTGTTDYNKYKFEMDFYNHTLSVWVNNELVVDRLAYDQSIEQYFANGFRMVIHQRRGLGTCYFKHIRAI
jgi:hypothetical protein